MKQKLAAGASIDVLTSDEMQGLLNPVLESLWLREEFDVFNIEYNAVASAGGVIASQDLYTVPVGYMVKVHRIEVNAPGATASSPLVTGQVGFFENDSAVYGNQWQFLPVSGVIAPVVLTEGNRSAKVLKGGAQIYISGTGLPANQAISFKLQVALEPGPRKMRKHK